MVANLTLYYYLATMIWSKMRTVGMQRIVQSTLDLRNNVCLWYFTQIYLNRSIPPIPTSSLAGLRLPNRSYHSTQDQCTTSDPISAFRRTPRSQPPNFFEPRVYLRILPCRKKKRYSGNLECSQVSWVKSWC